MAKNTFKPGNANTYRKQKPEEEKKPATRRKPSSSVLQGEFLRDPRLHLTGGLLLLFLSFFLSIAFVSYLFTGKADQSIVGSVFSDSVRQAGSETENWLGLTGAVVSH